MNPNQFGFPKFSAQDLSRPNVTDIHPVVVVSVQDHLTRSSVSKNSLNPAQFNIFDKIMTINSNADQCNAFLINAFADARKTYLLNVILHSVKRWHQILTVAPVAWRNKTVSQTKYGPIGNVLDNSPINTKHTYRLRPI